MSITLTRRPDPIARGLLVAAVGAVLVVFVAQPRDLATPAQAESVIVYATPAPDVSTPPLAVVAPLPAPSWIDQGLAVVGAQGDQFASDQAAALAQEQAAPPAAPASADAAPALADTAPALATIPAPEDLNDPQQNGDSIAPDGCPFPIINGRCANGVLAKTIPDAPRFGSKSTDHPSDAPTHQTKVLP